MIQAGGKAFQGMQHQQARSRDEATKLLEASGGTKLAPGEKAATGVVVAMFQPDPEANFGGSDPFIFPQIRNDGEMGTLRSDLTNAMPGAKLVLYRA